LSIECRCILFSRGLFIKLGFVQQQRSYQQKLGQVLPSFYMTKKL